MSKGIKIVYAVVIILAVLLAGKLFSEWTLSSELGRLEEENSKMNEKIASSEERQKQAIIQKRISEQLEEIAQQQKLVTEKQRGIALEQREIAEQKQKEALTQKLIADRAKVKAEGSFEDAERQRKIAIKEKNAAEIAEKNSNRLRMLALSRSLAARSINQFNSGNDTIASMLALTAWGFNSENNGNTYQPELFQSLQKAANEENSFSEHHGYIRDVEMLPSGNGFLTISELGELRIWNLTNGSIKSSLILNKEGYDFRKLAIGPNGDLVAISDAGGNVHTISLSNPSQYSNNRLSDFVIDELVFLDEKRIAFVSGASILVSSPSNTGSSVDFLCGHSQLISCFRYSSKTGELYFSDVNGKLFSHNLKSSSNNLVLDLNGLEISCFDVDESSKIVLGTISGKIFLFDPKSKKMNELIGHTSGVNDVLGYKDLIFSIGYDRTVRLWIEKGNAYESTIIENHSDWGYAIAITGDNKLISVGNDKIVHLTTIDPQELAILTKARVTRDFTKEEWNTYVDQTVQQKSFR